MIEATCCSASATSASSGRDPQSVIHSMVEFVDGSTLAQASPPDMRLPIALALAWPDRVPGAAPAVDWTTAPTWTFEPLDEAFPAVELARRRGPGRGHHAGRLQRRQRRSSSGRSRRGDRVPCRSSDTVAEVLRAAYEWAAEPATVG